MEAQRPRTLGGLHAGCPRAPPRRRRRRFRRWPRPSQSPPATLPPQPTLTRVLTRTPPLPPAGCSDPAPRAVLSGSCSLSCRRAAGPRAGPEPGSGGLPEGVEYIPTRKKGKNPMKPARHRGGSAALRGPGWDGVAWGAAALSRGVAIGLPSGIILFLLAKREVDKNRLEQLKIRRKMMEANQGEYKTERYERPQQAVPRSSTA
uniref:Uncharacterized protein n=1 Tax=Strix occidentalis caurina TaxID=311401 RepID=A0A8D0F2A8_STROC